MRIQTRNLWLVMVVMLTTHMRAAERTGRVCVEPIARGESWKANDTGATERSRFTIQIDDLAGVVVSTNASGVFTNLPLADKHLVKIKLDGRPLTSFRFTFQEERGEHLKLWYNPFYGTWSLTDVRTGARCACAKVQPAEQSVSGRPSPILK